MLIYWHHCCPCSSSCAMDLLILPVPYRLYCEHPTGDHASSSIIGEWIIFLASPLRIVVFSDLDFMSYGNHISQAWVNFLCVYSLFGRTRHEEISMKRVNIKLNSPKMPAIAIVKTEKVFGNVMSVKMCCFFSGDIDRWRYCCQPLLDIMFC